MAVTLDDIATHLGVATPDPDSTTGKRWSAWIKGALLAIRLRAERLERDIDDLDQDVVDYVVTLAVVAMARKPDDATTVDISVDDGRVLRSYKSSEGRVKILDEWWDDLGLVDNTGAFSVRPSFEPDRLCPQWWEPAP